MAISEDLGAFFIDFGVTAVFGSQSAEVLFDSPELVVAEDYVLTAEYAITYPATKLTGLANGSTITVDGSTYKVNLVQSIEDGKLKKATLSKQ